MRIAYLTSDFGIPVHGNKGAAIHVRELSMALQAQGHEVEIITPRAGGDAPEGFSIPVHEYKVEKQDALMVGALQEDPEVGEARAKDMRAMLYSATLRYRVQPLLERFRPDALYERYSLLSIAGLDLAQQLGIPHILEVNAPLSEEAAAHRSMGFAQTVRATEQRVLGSAGQVISVSRPLKDWIVTSGADPERVTVVPNGVNIDRFASTAFDARARLGIGNRPVVGFVGTLKAWHGTTTLIEAVALLARERGIENAPHLLIVGDGPQREHLEQLAAREGIASITTFTGMVAHDEMPGWIAAMDVAVAPYDNNPDFYFSPLKLYEYMAAGKPVVAASVGQIRDCILDGETGLLYPAGDVPALAASIARVLDNPELAASLGRASRADAVMNHAWDRNATVVSALIEREQVRRIRAAGAAMKTEGR